MRSGIIRTKSRQRRKPAKRRIGPILSKKSKATAKEDLEVNFDFEDNFDYKKHLHEVEIDYTEKLLSKDLGKGIEQSLQDDPRHIWECMQYLQSPIQVLEVEAFD